MMTTLPPDVENCRILCALLRDYGIRHVVCSSGTRHLHLVRFFEGNDCFLAHRVVDERSAGFYAMGIALALGEPVACCCTSGTAAANYLTSMAECFYQHVPVVYITADRSPALLNQRCQQMIAQEHLFDGLCKRSVSLPLMALPGNAETSVRLVCDALLAMTWEDPGPVHVNVPVETIWRSPGDGPAHAYELDGVRYRRIERVTLEDDVALWRTIAERLQQSKRVLVAFGQVNRIFTERDRGILDAFADRFDCAICHDHLANFQCHKAVLFSSAVDGLNAGVLQQAASDAQEMLTAELLITLYGHTVVTLHPLVSRERTEHWDVNRSGQVQDPHGILTKLFACDPMRFLERVAELADGGSAADTYFQTWKKYEENGKSGGYRIAGGYPVAADRNGAQDLQEYAIGRLFSALPSKAVLHLANSSTVRLANRCRLPGGVRVFCNRGTNGIDGSLSAFLGQALVTDAPCFLLIGDLSFFYDMNAIWGKELTGNIRIMVFNNDGAALLRHHESEAITASHGGSAREWALSCGLRYLNARSRRSFDRELHRFLSDREEPMLFEVFC